MKHHYFKLTKEEPAVLAPLGVGTCFVVGRDEHYKPLVKRLNINLTQVVLITEILTKVGRVEELTQIGLIDDEFDPDVPLDCVPSTLDEYLDYMKTIMEGSKDE